MLVLSRRVDQEIVFPYLGITLSILQIRGRIVKVGIVAPREIKVLRSEAMRPEDVCVLAADVAYDSVEAEHRHRNQLNLLQLRLDAIQTRIDRGELMDAETLLQGITRGTSSSFEPVPSSPAQRANVAGANPIRLLLVEDSDNERGLMAQVLASQGFVIHVARDGNEALEQMLMQGLLPDFVLMDIQMPLADGAETLRRLRQDGRFSKLRVFAVTGTHRRVEEEPGEGGWDGWFQKPVDLASLVTRIRNEYARQPAVVSSVST